MKLIISEKAIAGRRIASILAGQEVPQTTEAKAPVFLFEKGSEEFAVVPLRGHIMDVDFPKRYSYWIGTDLKQLNSAPIEYVVTEKSIVDALKAIGKQGEEVIIATDADREGEAIGVEALNVIKGVNPKIRVKRALFSAITPKDIQDAFAKPIEVDYHLADSADSRREIDLIWGAVLTRFISIVSGRLGKDFLSAGRVQTPTLALIVDREKERRAFNKQKFWVLNAVFEKDAKKFLAEHKKGRFWEKAEAEQAFGKKGAKHGTVTKVFSQKRTLAKPIPFNTTGFLRAASAIGLTAGEAMNIAETLYQMGHTSYPRTDNTVYPKNLDLKAVLQELTKCPDFAPEIEKIFRLGKIEPSAGKESKDHPPIHPVSAAPKSKLTDRQWKVYELIVRRFLATLAEDAETMNQAVDIDLEGEAFVARGQLILKKGWKEFYPYSQLNEVILPPLKERDQVRLDKLEMLEKETEPPARYSQGSLIKLMEDSGLGTKATRHEIIKKLYARAYIHGLKALEPNEIAFSVTAVLEQYASDLTKPKMTAELEKEMDLIAAGKKTKAEVVENSRKFLLLILEELLKNKSNIGGDLRKALQADSFFGACDKCGQQLRKIKSRNNKWFLGCTGYPKCTNTYPLPQNGKITPLNAPCKDCNKPTFRVIGMRYRYEMCVDPNCPSKKDWKEKAKTRAKEMEAKEAAEEETPITESEQKELEEDLS